MTVTRSLILTSLPDSGSAAKATAQAIAEQVAEKPDSLLGLATGGTMEPVYAHLVRAHQQGLSFAKVRTVNLDEYVGLSRQHPNSYHSYMAQHFFDKVDIPDNQRFIPKGDQDPEIAAQEYGELLDRLGPTDLQLLGVGSNGHIAFNEPGTPIDAPTRVVNLTPATMQANARFFDPGEEVPTKAVTMGTAQILSSRRLLVLAIGSGKASALALALDGPVGPDCPASYLRTHPNCRIITDWSACLNL